MGPSCRTAQGFPTADGRKMTEVVIDVTRLLRRRLKGLLATGIDRVCIEYVRHFSRRAGAVVRFGPVWWLLAGDNARRLFDALITGEAEGRFKFRTAGSILLNGPGSISSRRLRNALYLNVGHSGLESMTYAHRLNGLGMRSLFFIHDLIPISCPEFCRPGESIRHRARMETALNLGRGVLVNSSATLHELSRYAQGAGLRLPSHAVAPLGAAPLPAHRSGASPLCDPYFLMLGTIEPRKNHWLILQVWRHLVAQLGPSTPRLVVVGRRGWESENIIDLLDRSEVLKPYVIELSRCSDRELAGWITHARALLFPSFAEGYGIPLVEALMLGAPVIASDLAVFREIAGDIPTYLSPIDGAAWLNAIRDYCDEPSLSRAAQLRRLQRFECPTWDAHFQIVEEFMDRISRAELGVSCSPQVPLKKVHGLPIGGIRE